ncbi:hypothetical protein G6F56_010818 [Rhizopus delemar]|nr:hypothetical protein G6F56_010818 [Rhizopus delemar]
MFTKERTLPKALNIVRPTLFQDSCSTSPSELSTMSNFSSSRPPPTIFNPGSFFQSVNTFKSSTVGVNPHRFLQRPRSNSTVSSFFSAFSEYSASGDEYDDDLDSIDGMTDEEEIEEETEEETEEEEHVQVVARVKHGTIMNGKGEFVNKSKNDHWLDESRANRKIADLEIENQTLLSLNASLEYKVKQQAEYINELEKRLQQV